MGAQTPFRFGAVAFSPLSSRDEWVGLARKAEDQGYATLGIGDHPSGGGGPIASAMAAADATTTLRITSHVFANDFRHPALLAQEAASLDLLSGGRFELGIGSGWNVFDYASMGIKLDPPGVRIGRLEEAVPLIRRLWGSEPVTFAGKYYEVNGLNLLPKPSQQPRPPILIGGGGKRVLSLAGREADIVSLDPIGTAAGSKDWATASRAAVAEKVGWVKAAAGTRFDALELHIFAFVVRITGDRRAVAEEVLRMFAGFPPEMISNPPARAEEILESPHYLIGSVEHIVEQLQAWRENLGISYITVPDFLGSMDALVPVVERLAGR